MTADLQGLVERELVRREKRNLRDRLAREFIRDNPGIREDPDGFPIDGLLEGTTEAAVRGIARFYKRKAEVRKVLEERDLDG